MRLADHCRENRPPGGLRWIKACPINRDAAIEFVETRRIDEAVTKLMGHLH